MTIEKKEGKHQRMNDKCMWAFKEITVCIEGVWYVVPGFSLTDVMWPLPDTYRGDKYVWADDPFSLTSVEMVRSAILKEPARFISFILP